MKLIFDVGMYNGADTAYYLESGYRVVAVEANPSLVEKVAQKYRAQIESDVLTCVNSAISVDEQPVQLFQCGEDLGASSVFEERVSHRRVTGSITVPGVTLDTLFERHGVPHYLKVDIEGADRLCILALSAEKRPTYVSFEVGDDVEELIARLQSIGYKRFKIIDQDWFRELSNQRCWYDRITRRLMRYLGYAEPRMVRRSGRFFLSGHSSGPVPWKSDGQWSSAESACARLRAARDSNQLSGWYDIHATV